MKTIKSVGITYAHEGLQPFGIAVYLNSDRIGTITRDKGLIVNDAWQFNYFYEPRGGKPFKRSDAFPSADAVKASIEAVLTVR